MGKINPYKINLKNGALVEVRSLTMNDALAVEEFITPVVASTFFLLMSLGEENMPLQMREEWLHKNLTENHMCTVGVFAGDMLLGLANITAGSRKKNLHRSEFGMSVHPDFRRLGVGELLLKGLLAWVQDNPTVEKVQLSLMSDNKPALKLYEKFGFVTEGLRPRAFKLPDGTFQSEVIMGKIIPRG